MATVQVNVDIRNAMVAVAQFASTDKNRVALHYVQMKCVNDQSTVRVLATDGHILAYVNVISVDLADMVRCCPNSTAYVAADNIVSANKLAPKGPINVMDTATPTNSLADITFAGDYVSFPDVDTVLSQVYDASGEALGINTDYLALLGKVGKLPGVKHKKDAVALKLTPRGPRNAITWELNGADFDIFGVLMPYIVR